MGPLWAVLAAILATMTGNRHPCVDLDSEEIRGRLDRPPMPPYAWWSGASHPIPAS
jgi:hypothetical protein